MRCVFLAMLAACTPDIVGGAYQCGANESCPTGLVCNQETSACEVSSEPFDCSSINEPAGAGDTAATAMAVDTPGCANGQTKITNCVTQTDAADWFTFDTTTGCTATNLHAQVIADRAFAEIYVSYEVDGTPGTVLDAECGDTDDDSPTRTRCFVAPIPPGSHVAVGVTRKANDGTDCDGACQFNGYQLVLQLATQ